MRLRRVFETRKPALDWLQVDITSHCNAACIYCPRHVFRDRWLKRHLPFEVFQRLLPDAGRTAMVHLQGWGEPFCHPDFFRMLKAAKAAGLKVGTTTNGLLVDDETATRLVEEGLDVLAFSLAGIDQAHDRIRRGTSLDQVKRAVAAVHRAKERLNLKTPVINAAYMMLRSGLNDLDLLPSFLEKHGFSGAVVNSLSLVVDPALTHESVLAATRDEYQRLSNRADALREEASARGLNLAFHVCTQFSETRFCSENVGRALVVGSDGAFGPCVMTRLPLDGPEHYYFKGKKGLLPDLSFGNARDDSLAEVWRQSDYRHFRRTFGKGRVLRFCAECQNRFADALAGSDENDGLGFTSRRELIHQAYLKSKAQAASEKIDR